MSELPREGATDAGQRVGSKKGLPAGAMPTEMREQLQARLRKAHQLSPGEYDKAKLAELRDFYGVRKLETMPPAACASFLRDVEALILEPDLATSLPPFEFKGCPQAQILPRATVEQMQLVRTMVPAELRALGAWVACDRGPRTQKKTGIIKSSKIPLNPHTGENARSDDDSTWGTFEEAAQHAVDRVDSFGVGINLLGSPYLGLDLDDVVGADGNLEPNAQSFIRSLPSTYTEVSPSGRGLRLFFRGSRPEGLARYSRRDAFGAGKALEVYDGNSGARYLTATGQVWNDRRGPVVAISHEELRPLADVLAPRRKRRPRNANSDSSVSGPAAKRDRGSTDSGGAAAKSVQAAPHNMRDDERSGGGAKTSGDIALLIPRDRAGEQPAWIELLDAVQTWADLPPRDQLSRAKQLDASNGNKGFQQVLAYSRSLSDWHVTGFGWARRTWRCGVGHGNIGQFCIAIRRDTVFVDLFTIDEWNAVDAAEEMGDAMAITAALRKGSASCFDVDSALDNAIKNAVEQACEDRPEVFTEDSEAAAIAQHVAKLLRKNLTAGARQRIKRS